MAKKTEKAAVKATDKKIKKALSPASKKAPAAGKTVKKIAAEKKSSAAAAPKKGTAVKSAPKAAPAKSTSIKSAPKAAAPAKAAAKSTVKKNAAGSSPVKKTVSRVRKDEILKKLRLSKADKKYFYDLLMHARLAFGTQVRYHSDDALTRKDAAGERAGMATHMADLGTDNYRRDFELGLLSDGVDVLEMIDEALQRLEDSEYGICLDCGEPIPRKRLEAKPYAKYCTKCKSKREAMDETYYHRR